MKVESLGIKSNIEVDVLLERVIRGLEMGRIG